MHWLSVDPGETTGWASWEDDQLVDAGQTPLLRFADEVAASLGLGDPLPEPPTFHRPARLVIERFALYPWKMRDLEFDEVRTARLIGMLELCARLGHAEVTMQPATIKKPAMAGGAKSMFLRPLHDNRHANDAIMHGWYYVATQLRGVTVVLPSGREAMAYDPLSTVSDR